MFTCFGRAADDVAVPVVRIRVFCPGRCRFCEVERGPWGLSSRGMNNLLQGTDNDNHSSHSLWRISHARISVPSSQCTSMMDNMLVSPYFGTKAATYREPGVTQDKCLAIY